MFSLFCNRPRTCDNILFYIQEQFADPGAPIPIHNVHRPPVGPSYSPQSPHVHHMNTFVAVTLAAAVAVAAGIYVHCILDKSNK